MPFATVSQSFHQWFFRPNGGLHNEKWLVDLGDREKIETALLRVAWRSYWKGRVEGKRGYTEMTIRRKVAKTLRKKFNREAYIIREGE